MHYQEFVQGDFFKVDMGTRENLLPKYDAMGVHKRVKITMCMQPLDACMCSHFGSGEPPRQIASVDNKSVHAPLMT